ncbi:MAG: sulfatase-like hydrolase/transferase [Halanaerobiales bacterium]|nr:sulfatase-like hydrolase/transferase [Halanaerobiales bacterium]
MFYIIGLSVLLIIIAFYLFLNTKSTKFSKIIFNIIFLFSFSLHILFLVSYYFTGEGINDAVLYHIKYGLAGASFLEYWKIVLFTVISFVLIFFVIHYIFNKKKKYKFRHLFIYISFIVISLSIIINPASYDLYNIYLDRNREANFNEYYKSPSIEKIGESKNFVYIYAESFERTYFNEKLFPGLVTELKKLEKRSTYFTDIRQVAGTSWTIGGMVSSQLGIPLFTPINNKDIEDNNDFLPKAKGVGDLLSKEGYYLTFFGGADLEFQEKGTFYKTHKFDEIQGLNDLSKKIDGEKNLNNWGIDDDKILELAYNRFMELSANKNKFGMYLITLGTHHPQGHIPEEYRDIMYKDGSNPILNAIKASDVIISEFVNKILDSKYAKDTVIIIASDHLAMRNTAFDRLEDAKRRNMFMILSPDQKDSKRIDKRGSTLDIGPTILSFIGYDAQIALGRDLLDNNTSGYEIKKIHDNLISWKAEIKNFWGKLAEDDLID